MEPKKYEKYNLNRNSPLFFSIGLALVLLLIYTALEWKSYPTAGEWDTGWEMETESIDWEVPITIHQLNPPPKQIQAPQIKVVEDQDDIIESIIETTEIDADTEVITVDQIEVLEMPEDEEFPIYIIEEVPVFPGCENSEDKRRCFEEMMKAHVRSYFRYPEPALEMGLEGRVFVKFTIQKDGSIKDIQMRGPHKILEEEAGRIIGALPTMAPGKQRGKAVKVPFTMPIVFKLQ